MFKKLLIASAVLTVMSSATAFASVGGPYVGVSLGADDSSWHTSFNGNSTISIVDPDTGVVVGTDSTNLNSRKDLGAHGLVGTIFAGYGEIVSQNVYLGGEIFANLASTEAHIKTTYSENNTIEGFTDASSISISDKLSTEHSFGVSAIPGFMLSNNTMAFARIGYVRTRFNHSTSLSVAQSDSFTGISFNKTYPFSDHVSVNGGQLGLGLQTSIMPNVDARVEYVYTAYQSFSSLGENISPRNNQFNLGLVYKFG